MSETALSDIFRPRVTPFDSDVVHNLSDDKLHLLMKIHRHQSLNLSFFAELSVGLYPFWSLSHDSDSRWSSYEIEFIASTLEHIVITEDKLNEIFYGIPGPYRAQQNSPHQVTLNAPDGVLIEIDRPVTIEIIGSSYIYFVFFLIYSL